MSLRKCRLHKCCASCGMWLYHIGPNLAKNERIWPPKESKVSTTSTKVELFANQSAAVSLEKLLRIPLKEASDHGGDDLQCHLGA
eukprot:4428922-Amphidinium_carterae.1